MNAPARCFSERIIHSRILMINGWVKLHLLRQNVLDFVWNCSCEPTNVEWALLPSTLLPSRHVLKTCLELSWALCYATSVFTQHPVLHGPWWWTASCCFEGNHSKQHNWNNQADILLLLYQIEFCRIFQSFVCPLGYSLLITEYTSYHYEHIGF